MRGENYEAHKIGLDANGSPPHARGKLYGLFKPQLEARITPACAGKTYRSYAVIVADKDHPRMRGENWDYAVAQDLELGSPPHARGRRRARRWSQ